MPVTRSVLEVVSVAVLAAACVDRPGGSANGGADAAVGRDVEVDGGRDDGGSDGGVADGGPDGSGEAVGCGPCGASCQAWEQPAEDGDMTSRFGAIGDFDGDGQQEVVLLRPGHGDASHILRILSIPPDRSTLDLEAEIEMEHRLFQVQEVLPEPGGPSGLWLATTEGIYHVRAQMDGEYDQPELVVEGLFYRVYAINADEGPFQDILTLRPPTVDGERGDDWLLFRDVLHDEQLRSEVVARGEALNDSFVGPSGEMILGGSRFLRPDGESFTEIKLPECFRGHAVLSDLDGDGLSDVVRACARQAGNGVSSNGAQVEVFRGTGDPVAGFALQSEVRISTVGSPGSLHLMDIDQDGRRDVFFREDGVMRTMRGGADPFDFSAGTVMGSSRFTTVEFLQNSESQAVQAFTLHGWKGLHRWSFADGEIAGLPSALVLGLRREVHRIVPGEGTGRPQGLAVLLENGVVALTTGGRGAEVTLEEFAPSDGFPVVDVVIGDFDGDGVTDSAELYVVGRYDQRLRLRFGGSPLEGGEVVEVDGSSFVFLVHGRFVEGAGLGLVAFEEQGARFIHVASDRAISSEPVFEGLPIKDAAVMPGLGGSIDGLVVLDPRGGISTSMGGSSETLNALRRVPGPLGDMLAVGDLDGEGPDEVVVGYRLAQGFEVYQDTGEGGMKSVQVVSASDPDRFDLSDVAVADLDGDSRGDVAVSFLQRIYPSVEFRSASGLSMFRGLGTGQVHETALPMVSHAGVRYLEATDVDGDGRPNLVVLPQNGGGVVHWYPAGECSTP